MIKWFKELFYVVKHFKTLEQSLALLEEDMKDATALIRDRTEVSVDVGIRGPSRIVLTGRYRNNDYMEIFDIPDKDFTYVVDMLKGMRKTHEVRCVEGPFQMKSLFEHAKREINGY